MISLYIPLNRPLEKDRNPFKNAFKTPLFVPPWTVFPFLLESHFRNPFLGMDSPCFGMALLGNGLPFLLECLCWANRLLMKNPFDCFALFRHTVALIDSASRNVFLKIFVNFKGLFYTEILLGFQIRSQIWQGCSEVCFFLMVNISIFLYKIQINKNLTSARPQNGSIR